MAEGFNKRNISEEDTLDINELASLNNDITDDFIEQLQNQVSQNAQAFSEEKDVSTLFEEVQPQPEPEAAAPEIEQAAINERENTPASLNNDLDDNFIKKYKAKLLKEQNASAESSIKQEAETAQNIEEEQPLEQKPIVEDTNVTETKKNDTKDIEVVSGGNITERSLEKEQIKYKESLDYLDNNTKYSKYVIYIDPENKEFIDSLTVKERKNLINRIIREQDDIAITKRKLNKTQTVITHAIVALLTVIIAIPVIYWAINASLEATINNYRSSQSMFQTLYKEHGKIKTTR